MSRIDYVSSLSIPKCAMKFNGIIFEEVVPGYRTNSVSGRESFSSDYTDLTSEIKDGAVFVKNKRLSRDIQVEFNITTDTPEEYMVSCNLLKGLIRDYSTIIEEKENEIIFMDEDYVFYKGVVTSIEFEKIDELLNASGNGTISIHCADPFKYSVQDEVVEVSRDVANTFVVDYDGTYFSKPTFEVRPSSDLGFITFFNNEKRIIQVGDPEEGEFDIDSVNSKKSEALINSNFKIRSIDVLDSWSKNVTSGWRSSDRQTPSNAIFAYAQIYIEGRALRFCGLKTAQFGTKSGTKNAWYGPSLNRMIPADKEGAVGARNFRYEFDFSWDVHLKNWQWIAFSVDAANDKSMAIFSFIKDTSGSNYVLERFELNGKIVKEIKIVPTSNQFNTYSTTLIHAWLHDLYKSILNREIDLAGDEIAMWRNELHSGKKSPGQVVMAFFNSKEYKNRNRTDEQFIKDCYAGFLERVPTNAELQDWLSRLQGFSKAPSSGGLTPAQIEDLANRAIRGEFGNGDARKRALGDNYYVVQNRINEKFGYPARYPVDNKAAATNKAATPREQALVAFANSPEFTLVMTKYHKSLCYIEKIGSEFDFCDGRVHYKFKCPELLDVEAKRVNIWNARYSGDATTDMLWISDIYRATFYKHKALTWKDIPNKLSAGSVIEVNTSKGEILVNNGVNHNLGAIGNDWETFVLKPGLNQIGFTYSVWGDAPNVIMKYKKVYL